MLGHFLERDAVNMWNTLGEVSRPEKSPEDKLIINNILQKVDFLDTHKKPHTH